MPGPEAGLCAALLGDLPLPHLITGRKSLELLLHLNAALMPFCPGSSTAPTDRPCNRLSHPLPSASSCSSRKFFPAPVTNQGMGDLSELWDLSLIHQRLSRSPWEHLLCVWMLLRKNETCCWAGWGESHSFILTKQSGYGLVCISIPAFAGT